MRVLLPWLCAVIAPAAFAAGNDAADRRAVDFAIGFCGKLVGGDPAELPAAARALEGVTVHPARRPDPDSDPPVVKRIADHLHVAPDAMLHWVSFNNLPSGTRVVALLPPNLSACHVIVTSPSEAYSHAATRIAADPEWREVVSPPGPMRFWQRKRNNGVIVTMYVAGASGGATTINLTSDSDVLLPTFAEFDAFARGVVLPCAQSALNGGKLDPARFKPLFDPGLPNDDGSIVLVSKTSIPGGRLLLAPEAWGTSCVLEVDPDASFEYYRTAFADAFKQLKGAARSQAADKRWLAPGPNPDNWVYLFDTTEDERLVVIISRD